MQFFVLRVASNKEDRVREALARKVKIEALEQQVGRILVPVEKVRQIKADSETQFKKIQQVVESKLR